MSRTFDLLRQPPNDRPWPQLEKEKPTVRETLIPPPRPQNQRPTNSGDAGGWDWLQAARSVAKYWKLSAVFAASVFLAVAAVTFLMKPEYAPMARLEVDPPGAEMFSLNGGPSMNGDAVGAYMGTQVQKLQGDELAVDVIHKLSLNTNPEFLGKAVQSGTAPTSDFESLLPPAESKALEVFRSDAVDVIRKLSLTNPEFLGREVQSRTAPTSDSESLLTPDENKALRAFRRDLTVKPEGGTNIINVSFAAHDPVLAARVTNTLANMFVERNYNERHEIIQKSSEWLSKQLDDIRAKMEQSNKELADFERQTGITDIDEKQNSYGLRIAELNHDYTAAQADRIQSQAYIDAIRYGKDDDLPQVRDNPVIQALTQKMADTETQLAEAQVIYGPAHPNVKKLENQAKELKVQLAAQRKRVIGAIEASYAAAKARETLTAGELKGASSESSRWGRYTDLRKDAETNRELYNTLYTQVKEAGISAASKSSNVRVVDQARVLDRPTKPRRVLNLALGLVAGMFGGILLAFLRQNVDKTIRAPSDVRQWSGLSAVTIIPIAAGHPNQLQGKNRGLLASKSKTGRNKNVDKVVLERPRSPEAEALRSLETSILLSNPQQPPRVILVVSPFAGEGKTTIAVNLAIMLARRGTTCLVDADLRRPSVTGVFDCADGNFSEVLSINADLEKALVPVLEVPSLWLLNSRETPPNPVELISSESMQNTLSALRGKFDFVVIDSPPVLPFADGRILSTQVDGLVFVSRSGSTSQESVAESIELLAGVHAAPIVGFVLNGGEHRSSSYYGYPNEA